MIWLLACLAAPPAEPPAVPEAPPRAATADPLDVLTAAVAHMAQEVGATRVYLGPTTVWLDRGLVDLDPTALRASNTAPLDLRPLAAQGAAEVAIFQNLSEALADLEARPTGKAVWMGSSAPAIDEEDATVLVSVIEAPAGALEPVRRRLRLHRSATWTVTDTTPWYADSVLGGAPSEVRACDGARLVASCAASDPTQDLLIQRVYTQEGQTGTLSWWLVDQGRRVAVLESLRCGAPSEDDVPHNDRWCERLQLAWMRPFEIERTDPLHTTIRARSVQLWHVDATPASTEASEWRVELPNGQQPAITRTR